MKKYFYYLLIATVSVISLSSCLDSDNSDEEYQEYLEQLEAVYKQYITDSTLIADYLAENDSVTMFDSTYNFFYNIIEEGDEAHPNIYSVVSVEYKGQLLDGSVFDETEGEPILFNLNNLLNGWKAGLPLIGKGGRIILYLPSYLGYGTNDNIETIPANSVLIFDIKLVDFYYY